MGSHVLGMHACAFLERNDLACHALKSNFAQPVVQGSVEDMTAVCALHEHRPSGLLQVTCGFPCQPYSQQGDLQGLQDARGTTLEHTLRAAWLLQADAVLLECVANVANFPDVQALINSKASEMQMQCSRLILGLKQQWPISRNRFWCHLFSNQLPALHMQPWPQTELFVTLGNLMPLDCIWTDQDESHLAWTPSEMAVYTDSRYGMDQRIMGPHHQAATVLHSWGNITNDCPCGCRKAFTPTRLLTGGARGFGVISSCSNAPRHMHPEEGMLLCTVPLDFCQSMPPRSLLCLLGQIATPLQVLWTQAQFLAHFQLQTLGDTAICPSELILDFQRSLLAQHRRRWTTRSMQLPRTLHLELDDSICLVQVQAPVRAHELQQAEKAIHGWGQLPVLFCDGLRLPPDHMLHEDDWYQIQIKTLRQAKPCPIATSQCLVTPNIIGLGLDAELPAHLGLGDKLLWECLQIFKQVRAEFGLGDTLPFMPYPFKITHYFASDLPAMVLHDWKRQVILAECRLLLLVEYRNHWVVLFAQGTSANPIGLCWTCFDGLDSPWKPEIFSASEALAQHLTSSLDFQLVSFNAGRLFEQTLPYTCGAIALAHAAQLCGFGFFDPRTEYETHCGLLQLQGHPSIITALGADPVFDQLVKLLEEKGVPTAQAPNRAKQVVNKLGQQSVKQSLLAKNPWAALKAAASKPGVMFRLVTETELRNYVNDRAKTQHGAAIKDSKAKKKASSTRPGQAPVDPSKLELNAQHFQDADGNPVSQLSFADVGSDQRGVALCNIQQATPFFEHGKTISADALALILVDTPPPELIQDAGIAQIVVPAYCPGTGEHTLLFCHILQLGDSKISRKTAGKACSVEVTKTQVLKFQVFRDQLEFDWTPFTKAPIKALVSMMESLQLCHGQQCGSDCAKFHSGIDEQIDTVIFEVWSRTWFNDKGAKTDAESAVCFTAFLRTPFSAVKEILRSSPPGVYIEPRGELPKQHDDRYRVIWLPGASASEASHHSMQDLLQSHLLGEDAGEVRHPHLEG